MPHVIRRMMIIRMGSSVNYVKHEWGGGGILVLHSGEKRQEMSVKSVT